MDPISLITFQVGKQLLALPIDQVREVIRNTPISSIANWTGLLHGIINIRSKVIPILDLRLLLGEGEPQNTRKTRIILVEMLSRMVGLVVDQVDDIAPLTKEQLVPLSSISIERQSSILVGVAKIDQRLYLVLDVEELVHEEERNLFQDICLRLNRDVP